MIEVSLVAHCRLEHTVLETQLPDITLGRIHATPLFLARQLRLVVSPPKTYNVSVYCGGTGSTATPCFET